MKLHRIAAVAGAVALLVPAAVSAKGKPGDAGSKGKSKSEEVSKGKNKPKTFLFKGTWNDEAGTVSVTGGNSRVRKGEFKGTEVTFDFADAKIKVADTNADGETNADDFVDGDKLVVKAKLPRGTEGTGPFAAGKAVNQTHPAEDEDSDETETEPTETETEATPAS